ncbi:type I restriction enzyme S subunit [Bradyrhizobium liaoningense]
MPIPAFRRYERYKNSAVSWLGRIPENWQVQRLQHFATCNDDVLVESKYRTIKIKYVDISAVNAETNIYSFEEQEFADAPSRARRLVKSGDTIFSTVRPYLKSVATIEKPEQWLVVSTGFAVARPVSAVDARFLGYVLRNDEFIHEVSAHSVGASYPAINASDLFKLKTCAPDYETQCRIRVFLDDRSRKIDQAISIKEQQIVLLKERKQIIIQDAVTKGLNPNVPMKTSGVGWIEQIPAHWEVWRSKFLFTQRKEFARKNDIQLSATQSYGVIPQEKFEELVGRRVVKIETNLEKRKHVEIDDFVISMRSFQGGLERAWATGCIRSSYVILRPLEPVNADFFSYLFKSPRYIKALQATGSFIRDGQDLNFENFAMVDLYLPPLDEQAEIAAHIKASCEKIDTGVSVKESQIAALREYKATLINAAVTGKVKVA